MDFYTVAEVVSLVLTVPTVMFGALVVWFYSPRAIKALRKPLTEMSETEMLIIGITIGFAGAVSDNIYWGLAWFNEMLGTEYTEWWFRHGVVSNIPFRQGAGVIAGMFHLYPIFSDERDRRTLSSIVIRTTGASAIALLVLLAL